MLLPSAERYAVGLVMWRMSDLGHHHILDNSIVTLSILEYNHESKSVLVCQQKNTNKHSL